MKGALGAAFIIAVGVSIGIGCAKSENEESLFGIGHNDPADAGDEGGKKKKVVVGDDDDDKTPKKGDDDDDDSTSSSSSSSGGSSSSSGGSSSSSSSSSGSTTTGNDPCKVTVCNTAKTQTSISGDTSSAARTITGAASQWFTVDVTEDVTGIFSSGQDLRLKATLTSPPGKNFDLFLYLPDSGGVKECHHGEESSEEAAGVDDVVHLEWGEGSQPNGQSDTRTISIEVREIVDPAAPPATCDPTAKWTLKLEGNK